MSPTRIYRVNDYLVEASSQAAAVNHIARGTLSVRVATRRDLVELRDKGVDIQRAGKPWSLADVKVVFKIPESLPAEARAAGEEYLKTAGVAATNEGLIEAMISRFAKGVEIQKGESSQVRILPADPETLNADDLLQLERGASSFTVGSTDPTGKPATLVLEG